MNYYAWANRYRGDGHKLTGCVLLAAPSVALVTLILGLGYGLGLIPLLWASLGVLGYILLITIHILIIFKWFWGSDYWPSLGKAGDLRKLTDLWLEKSVVAFALIGNPWFGFKMQEAGGIYFRCLTPEMPDSIARAERLIGELYGWQILKATAVHVVAIAAFIAWRAL
jgi:hypothetical protein